ncbi:hypothetical protein LSH36_3g33076 [Paralvinella palmiformis]|uniref:Uncharacterized protein n=1 Tax=Paralvinella palmiformis TaxID=53620 RepID=A0AAD9KG00_9ANNE|nr:hypothetical protein LSH36_3g33076 [Paralvinella palmiformis]
MSHPNRHRSYLLDIAVTRRHLLDFYVRRGIIDEARDQDDDVITPHCENSWQEGDVPETRHVTPSKSRSLQGPLYLITPTGTRSCHQVNLESSVQSVMGTADPRHRQASVKVTCPFSRERDVECLSVGSASNSDSGRGHSSEGETEGHRHGNRVNDLDQIKMLAHQLYLKKQQLRDWSSTCPRTTKTTYGDYTL